MRGTAQMFRLWFLGVKNCKPELGVITEKVLGTTLILTDTDCAVSWRASMNIRTTNRSEFVCLPMSDPTSVAGVSRNAVAHHPQPVRSRRPTFADPLLLALTTVQWATTAKGN